MSLTLNLNRRPLRLSWYQQGLVHASLDQLYGREILARAWDGDSGDPVAPPELFAALNQQPRLLLELTQSQIATVMMLDQHWGLNGSLWFNLSGGLLSSPHCFEALLQDTLLQIDPARRHRVVLEIAEDALDHCLVPDRVKRLRQAGFMVAMDDFGAGYSNLGRLQEGGFDILKLDLGLIRGVPERIWAANFYREVVELAASSGGLVVAEGVEHQTQSDFVRWAGVDLIQGFLYARPQPLLAAADGGLKLPHLQPPQEVAQA